MLNPILALLLSSTTLLAAAPTIKHLSAGDAVPDVALRTEEDKEAKLRQLVSARPTVLIFYRGGWCPFCNRHLKELAGIEKDLERAGAQLVAISMDQPAKLRATPNRNQLGYRLLSDSDAVAAQAFGIAFKVGDATVERYKGFKIDLDAASGRSHHLLPHPAVFVVDSKGVIRFAHVNPDYKARLAPAKILEAVRAAKN